MLLLLVIVLAAVGTVLWIGSPFSLLTHFGMRRDDRLHMEAIEDAILDEYSEHGLPDR